jgi:Glu-tRNA(Gln) amidotransferase subunit E-like FAD-binding protein
LDGTLENLKRKTRESGKLDRVLEIWIDEMKGSMNLESFTQVLAGFWAEELTLSELQQALEMVQSPIYKKLSELSDSMAQPKTIAPIVKEACNRTRVRAQAANLSTRDIDMVCRQFAP